MRGSWVTAVGAYEDVMKSAHLSESVLQQPVHETKHLMLYVLSHATGNAAYVSSVGGDVHHLLHGSRFPLPTTTSAKNGCGRSVLLWSVQQEGLLRVQYPKLTFSVAGESASPQVLPKIIISVNNRQTVTDATVRVVYCQVRRA